MNRLLKEFYRGKRVLITGAAGTVGREMVSHLSGLEPEELRLMDNNESEVFFLAEEYRGKDFVRCFLGDIRDRHKLMKLCDDIDIVIHAAAFKHVILSEYNPYDVVQTNIIGTENIIEAASACGVERVIFTSSDKAVNPTNVMGTSKLMGERLITAANAVKHSQRTIFSSTRFGNVIGSRGSVVPLFAKQIRGGGPVTLTDERMTRFVMTVPEAARLVLKSAVLARGGEVFVTKMPVVRISDLAHVMIEILAPAHGFHPARIEVTEIGAKAGEKLYEELMTDEETGRSLELGDMFVVTPAFKAIYRSIKYEYPGLIGEEVTRPYVSSSEAPVDREYLKRYLIEQKVLGDFFSEDIREVNA